jgi:hypothetical protein
MTIKIDEVYRNIICEYCSKIIDKKPKYYFDIPNSVLSSLDICKECSDKHRLL